MGGTIKVRRLVPQLRNGGTARAKLSVYSDNAFDWKTTDIFCKTNHIANTDLSAILRTLYFAGLTENRGRVKSQFTMSILMWMISNHQEWVEEFSKICSNCHIVINKKPIEIATSFSKGSPTFLRQNYSFTNDELLELIFPVFSNERVLSEISYMPLSLFEVFIGKLLPWLINNDIEASDALLQCWKSHPDYKEVLGKEWQLSLLYIFYASGSTLIEECNTWVKDIIEASKTEDYSNAIHSYEHSLSLFRGNTFSDYISNYLYGKALAFDNSIECRVKKHNISNCYDLKKQLDTIPLYLLARYTKDALHDVDDMVLSQIATYSVEKHAMGYGCMSFLLSSFMRRHSAVNLNDKGYVPNMWILRRECSAYIPLLRAQSVVHAEEMSKEVHTTNKTTTSQKSSSTSTVPPSSHTSIHKTPVTKPDAGTSKSSKMIYAITETCSVMPYAMTESPEDGKYTFNEISEIDYVHGNLADVSIDSLDRRIWNLWSACNRRFILSKVLRIINRTNKIYTKYHGQIHQAKLVFDPLYLEIKQEEDSFIITSNISSKDIEKSDDIAFKVEDSRILYTSIPLQYRQILRQLLSQNRYSLSQEEWLHSTFRRIRRDIEVRGDSYATGGTLPEYQASAKLVVRVSEKRNKKNVRLMSVFVRPFEDANIIYPAGEGANFCIAYYEGKRCKVKRNLNSEQQYKTQLFEYIRNTGSALTIDGKDRNTFSIDITHLLSLLKYISIHSDIYSVDWQCTPINVNKIKLSDIQTRLRRRENWFELEGNVLLDNDRMVNIRQFFNSVISQQGEYIQLGEHDYAIVEADIVDNIKKLSSGFNDNGHRLLSTKLGATVVSETLHDIGTQGDWDVLHENKERFMNSQNMDIDVPEDLNAKLRPYQQEGFEWMSRLAYWGAGACLADDMGLGKTLQSITFMLSHASEGASLVVAPSSVVKNWENEIHHFAPTIRTKILNTSKKRDEMIDKAGALDIVLVTYGLLVSMSEKLQQHEWTVICLDEAHTIKNKSTQTSSAAMDLKCKYRLALTGTPIQNNLNELWNIFQFINPGLLGGYELFMTKYVHPIMDNQDLDKQEQLKRIIAPFMKRRTKSEVVKELPTKTEETILVNLGGGEMEAYEHIRKQAEIKAAQSKDGNKMDILSEITKLRLAACSVQLQNQSWTGSCSKLTAFMDKIHEIQNKDSEAKILVFSQFTSFLSMAGCRLKEDNKDYLYLDGSISIKKRSKIVENFQNGKDTLFLISLQAGGLGLNLTAANYVILLDPWWNPAIEQQAIDRAYRIGQQRDVKVYHLISSNTIEEKIVRLQQKKKDLATALLTGEAMTGNITFDELKTLVTK